MTTNQDYVVSNVLEDQKVLQARFQELGYLFFKKTISDEKCSVMLQDFMAVLAPHITYNESAKAPAYAGTPFSETDPIWDEVYQRCSLWNPSIDFFTKTTFST